MINQAARGAIQKYFYGTKWPLLLLILGIFVPPLLSIIVDRNVGSILTPVCVLAAIVWAVKEKFMPDTSAEHRYDEQVKEDLEEFAKQAQERLGLVSEQVSLIDPIRVRGPYYDYSEHQLEKGKGIFRRILSHFRYHPHLIFRYGSDEMIRYSMVQFQVFIFSESQIYVYTASYDICTGEVFEESTSEYFYQDVDCVITGRKMEKVISKKKVINTYFEYFKLIVTSGTSTKAVVDGTSILNTQVRGMRELIRNKKEEITL